MTSTLMAQVVAASTVPALKLMDPPLAEILPAEQVVDALDGDATVTPAGNRSVKARPVASMLAVLSMA